MKLSTRMCYGTQALLEMGRCQNQKALSLAAISQARAISVKYLEQLMPCLKSGGFIRSIRGAKGGYTLTKPPSKIRMHDVYSCLEGSITTTECVERQDLCGRSPSCPVRPVWTEIHEAIMGVLESVTLQDMLDRSESRPSVR